MENQIDTSYFWGKLSLPYVTLKGTTSLISGTVIDKEQLELERYIVIYQKEFLTALFGSEVIPATVESYLKNDSLKTSPIANYVFCKVLPNYQSRSTASGEKNNNEDYAGKYFAVWNEMAKQCRKIREVLYNADYTNETKYPTDYTNEIYRVLWYV